MFNDNRGLLDICSMHTNSCLWLYAVSQMCVYLRWEKIFLCFPFKPIIKIFMESLKLQLGKMK